MNPGFSVIIPFDAQTREDARALAEAALAQGASVFLAGPEGLERPGVPAVPPGSGDSPASQSRPLKGSSLRLALAEVSTPVVLLQDPDPAYLGTNYSALVDPIASDSTDVVFATNPERTPATRALGSLAKFVTRAPVSDPGAGLRAFKTDALKAIHLTSEDDAIDSEILVKLAAQMYRFTEVPVRLASQPRRNLTAELVRGRALLRYATTHNDADNTHEGYNTLARMETAPQYNAWIGQKLRPHLGNRVLEVGAGIGTITEQLEPGRELVVALEVDPFYVDRLKNRFRDKPHVRPYLSGVEAADWRKLRSENLDTVVLSNVLEHIEDDTTAVRNFHQAIVPGGKLVILVPALPALFGSMDEAVGHFRRYTPERLRQAIEGGGFTVESIEWMNLVGIPGWFLNSRLLKRRAVPTLQLRAYDALAPALAQLEGLVKLPLGMSLFAVARANA